MTNDVKEMYASLSVEQQSMLYGIAVMATELIKTTYFANERNKERMVHNERNDNSRETVGRAVH